MAHRIAGASRRSLLGALALALAPLARPALAQEEPFPSRSITLIVPFAPGGANDIAARLVSPALGERLGRQVVVDNRAGAGGGVGMGQAARARADGYTLLLSSASNHVLNHLILRNQGYDPREIFAGIGLFNDVPLALVAHPALEARSIADVVALSRARPGGLAFGTSGAGSTAHLAGELFASTTGAVLEHVPYRGGGPALTDLMAGRLPLAWITLPAAMPQLDTGAIRVLGIASAERSPLRPDLPTLLERGVPGYVVRSWTGIFALRTTPRAVQERLSADLHAAVADPVTRRRLIDAGTEPIWMGPAETDAFIREEFERWAPVVARAGLAERG